MILPDFPSNLFTINFILGLPPLDDEPPDLESINGTIRAPIPVRAMVLEEIEAEMEEYGDMVMLPVNRSAVAYGLGSNGCRWSTT